MAGNGGARPGAGRPRKKDKYAGAITRAEKRIADKLPELIENMLTLAYGVLVEETNIVTGQPQVYQRAPDRAANEYLINRIMGKPTERQEISGLDGEPILFNWHATVAEIENGSDDDPETPS